MSIENITQQIVEDVQDALAEITTHIENPQAAITQVNVRVGQKSSLIADVEDLDASPFSAKNGWVIDIEFTPEQLKGSRQTFKTIDTYPVFKDLPIDAIKGLGSTWEQRFNGHAIYVIEDLVNVPASRLKEWSQAYDSLAPIEFRRKADMLDRQIPLSLVNESLDQNLVEWVYSDFSYLNLAPADKSREIALIKHFFEVCVAAIDIDALRKIFVSEFISVS